MIWLDDFGMFALVDIYLGLGTPSAERVFGGPSIHSIHLNMFLSDRWMESATTNPSFLFLWVDDDQTVAPRTGTRTL